MNLSELHLLRPWWLALLLPLAWLAWRTWRRRAEAGAWSAWCDPALAPAVLVADETGSARGLKAAALAAAALGIVALAGPTWQRLPQPVYRSGHALVVALDLSRSMDARDLRPSRLARARYKLADLLAGRPAAQVALVVYAAEGFAVTPLTSDVDTILAQLPALGTDLMPAQGSNVSAALEVAARLIRQAGLTGGDVLVVSDGVDAAERARALAVATRHGLRVSVLGVGGTRPVPIPDGPRGALRDGRGRVVTTALDETALRGLVRGGRYARLSTDDGDLERLATVWSQELATSPATPSGFEADRWQEAGPWLLLLALPLVAMLFRRGAVWLLLPFALLPPPAPALGLWQRDDQAAAELLERGEAAAAARRFRDPAWRGIAHYRAGEFAAAARAFASGDDADSLYNLGNAYARLGRYDDAIAAYRRALALAPGHADARHNLELLERLPRPPAAGEGADERDAGDGADDAEPDASGGPGAPAPDGGGRDAAPQQAEGGDEAGDAAQQRPDAQAAAEGQDGARDGAEQSPMREGEAEERERAAEQWLRQIPDDPGGLLRRKFLFQYRRLQTHRDADEPW